jgi:hypothetical protein
VLDAGCWVEDAADAARAGAGFGYGGGGEQVTEHGQGAGQLGEPLLGLVQVAAKQGCDVGAGRLAVVADREDAADLGQGQSGELGGADELQPVLGAGRVVAVPGRGAGRGGQQPGLLVEADRLGGGAGRGGEGSDAHACHATPLTFQRTGTFTVKGNQGPGGGEDAG